jgi:uncharacterized membrane protein
MHRLVFRLKQLIYDLRSGLLLRPGLITASLALIAVLSTWLDDHAAARSLVRSYFPGAFQGEPGAAQTLLGTIAGSMMTVVSIVYSILVMMLTLASMQFSPRVLAGMLRDRESQNTLGFFIGTFTYCLLVLRSVRGDPPFVPVLSVTLAIVFALLSLATLIYFIHHIAHNIQANYLVDAVARETEDVIDKSFPEPLEPGEVPEVELEPPEPPADAEPVPAMGSGYVQLLDQEALFEVARTAGVSVFLHRGVGEFAIEGQPLVFLHPPGRADEAARAACQGAFDLGEVRTMQDDVEFGVRQIVDIALKAISPAVNDPSTAATCIDHLGRLLCRLARRRIPSSVVRFSDPDVIVVLRRATFRSVLDLAFNQLRQYGRADMAVALRMLRTLSEVATAARASVDLDRIGQHGQLIEAELRRSFHGPDCEELEARVAALNRVVATRTGRAARLEVMSP